MRTRCLLVLLMYALTVVSAGAITNQETETTNYLKTLAEADSAGESILIAPDPSGGAWEKLVPMMEENYSTLLISSMDPNRFNPDLVFGKDLSIGSSKTARDYTSETDYFANLIKTNRIDNNQYLSGYLNRNIADLNHPVYEDKSIISAANSDLKYIYENDINSNRQKTRDVIEGKNQIYLSYLDHSSLKKPDELSQVAHLAGATDSYLLPKIKSPENLGRSPLFTDQNKTNNDLYKQLSTFEAGKEGDQENGDIPGCN